MPPFKYYTLILFHPLKILSALFKVEKLSFCVCFLLHIISLDICITKGKWDTHRFSFINSSPWVKHQRSTGEPLMPSKFFSFFSKFSFMKCCFYGMKYFILASLSRTEKEIFVHHHYPHVDLQFSRQQLSGTSVLLF